MSYGRIGSLGTHAVKYTIAQEVLVSELDNQQKPVIFHPFVKACAYFGAGIATIAAVDAFGAIFNTLTLWDALVAAGRASGCFVLAWSFWYAGKYSANPFKVPLFSK